MNYKILFVFLLLIIIFSFKEKLVAQKIENQNDQYFLLMESYKDALILSKEQDKKLFLLFTSEQCHWCEAQKELMLDQDVANKMQDYVVFYVDISKEKEISKTYKVRSVPAFFIIDDKENIQKKNVGYLNKEKLLKWIE